MPTWAMINPAYFTIAPGSITLQKMASAGNFLCPIGAIFPWLKSFTNTPALPSTFIECNGQVINDAASVYNGQNAPNLNGNNYFLMGNATSGVTGGSSQHRHSVGAGGDAILNATFNNYTDYQNHLPPYYSVVWVMRIK